MRSHFENERDRRRDNAWCPEDRGNESTRSGGFRGNRSGRSYDREENYFGSGRQGYGDGFSGTDRERGSGSYSRDFEDRSSYGRGDSDTANRDQYRSQEYENRGYENRSSYPYRESRGGYGGRYSGSYPSSEQGYQTNREYDEDRGWWDRASDEISSWFGDQEATRRRDRDEKTENHRGRGPRNYSRSDERITEDVNDRLTDDYYLDASDIDVQTSASEVTLTGTVENRYAKRRAEDIAEAVSGVRNVENRIRVKSAYDTNQSSYSTESTTRGATA